jgi:hypothetical protein
MEFIGSNFLKTSVYLTNLFYIFALLFRFLNTVNASYFIHFVKKPVHGSYGARKTVLYKYKIIVFVTIA